MNELIEPIISWAALLYGLVALLLIGAAVEHIFEKRQKARKVRQYQASRQRLTPSQKTIYKYYNTNKGA